MNAVALSVETFDDTRAVQDLSDFDILGHEVIDMLSMYDPYGVWRLDLETGHVYWSDDVFHIHGLEAKEGPVDLSLAINAYHPDDARVVGQLIEDCIANRSSYRFVLRIMKNGGGYKLVKSIGKFRQSPSGKCELVGLFSQLAVPIRTIAAIE